jgi:hypothetical protein
VLSICPATIVPAQNVAPPAAGQGELWIGTVRWTAKHTPTHRVTSSASLRLRERRNPGGDIELVHEGSTITVSHSTTGGGGCSQTGEGTSPATGKAGSLLRERTVGPNGQPQLGRWTYQLAITPDVEPVWTQTCASVDGPHTSTYGGSASGSWLAYLGESHDPVSPRILDGGRMYGSYRVAPGSSWEDSVSWSICRQGVSCPPPPADQEPCPEPPEKALLQTALAQQKLLMDRFGVKLDDYLRLANQAEQYRSDFELAIYTCNRISDLQVLLQLLIGQAPANIRKFNSYFGVLKNIMQGNATFVIDDYVGKRNVLMGEWGKIMFALDKVVPRPAPPLRNQLMPCAGSNLDTVFEGAMKFVQLMEQIEPAMRELNTLLNDQRSKDQEIFDLWSRYRPACIRHAQCLKIDANYCEKLPSIEGWSPSGPPSQARNMPASVPPGSSASGPGAGSGGTPGSTTAPSKPVNPGARPPSGFNFSRP